MTKLARACQVRNGLMVTLLALCPVRRRNFATLEIGRSFVEIKGKWWIVLSASQTKEKRADERPIDELLTPVIGRYLSQHRPVLARSDNPPSALWLSAKDGAPITDKEVARVIRTTTLSTVGGRGGPQQVRAHRYASSIAIHGAAPISPAPSYTTRIRASLTRTTTALQVSAPRKVSAKSSGGMKNMIGVLRIPFDPRRDEALSVDPLTLNQRVQGSSPCAPTNKINRLAALWPSAVCQ